MYRRRVDKVAYINKSYQQLDEAGVKDNTEELIMAAQKQLRSGLSSKTGPKMQAV